MAELNLKKYKELNIYYYEKEFLDLALKVIDGNYSTCQILKDTKRNYVSVIEIDGKNWSLNKIYAGVHWTVRRKDKNNMRLLVRSIIGMKKPFKNPVSIKMAFNSGLDVSNHGYIFKLIEDALVKCGVIQNDSYKYVQCNIMTIQKSFKGVIVEVEEI